MTKPPQPRLVIAADGSELHVRCSDAAAMRPLLFINAMGTTLSMWDRQVAAFPHRQTIRFDLRGTGGSGPSRSSFDVETLAHDALSVLDELGIDRADMVGSSMGGIITMWLAAHAPERVGRAVLSNTTPRLPNRAMWDERIAQARSEGLASIARTTIARWTTQDFAERDPDIVDSLIAEFAATPIAGYVGCCEFLRDTDMTPHLEKISVPTLVIAGAEDAASPLAASTELRDAIPGATLEVIPRAGHLSNIEQPQGYNEVLAEFFGETASE